MQPDGCTAMLKEGSGRRCRSGAGAFFSALYVEANGHKSLQIRLICAFRFTFNSMLGPSPVFTTLNGLAS